MKKRLVIFGITAVLSVIVSTSFIENEHDYIYENAIVNSADDVQKTPSNDVEMKYLIKLHEGNLCVYDWDKNIIDTITVDFNSMREYDKNLFAKGVAVEELEEIKHIAEDFSE